MENIEKGDYILGKDGNIPYFVSLVTNVKNSVVEFIYLNGSSGKVLDNQVRKASDLEIKKYWI